MNDYYETRYVFDKGRSQVWKAITEYLQSNIAPNATVLDLGSGYCDFINNVKAQVKIAVDGNKESAKHCKEGVQFIQSDVTDLSQVASSSVDVVFASNLLEHLDDEQLSTMFDEINRITRKDAKVILMQPNFRYCASEYFDDYTHKKVFSHVSLSDFLRHNNFRPIKIYPRFLPFSLKSILPKSYWLTKLYLMQPFKIFAKQMLIIGIKSK